MPNLVPMVQIDLDKERHLKFDLNALCEIEILTGQSFSDLDASMQTIRIVLWAGLIHEDADLTLQDVGKLIHGGNLAEVNRAVSEAFGATMPDGDADAEPAKNPNSSTGLDSGPSGAMI